MGQHSTHAAQTVKDTLKQCVFNNNSSIFLGIYNDKKSCTWEKPNLSTAADSSNNTLFSAGVAKEADSIFCLFPVMFLLPPPPLPAHLPPRPPPSFSFCHRGRQRALRQKKIKKRKEKIYIWYASNRAYIWRLEMSLK